MSSSLSAPSSCSSCTRHVSDIWQCWSSLFNVFKLQLSMLFSTKQTWRLWCCSLVRPSVVENENYDPNDTNQWPKGPRWPEGLKGPKGPKWTKIYADTKLFFWSDLLWNFVKSTISSIFSYSWDYLKEAVVVAQTSLTCLSCAVRGGGGGGSTLELDNCRSGVRACW